MTELSVHRGRSARTVGNAVRVASIAFFVIFAGFPAFYMASLSFKNIGDLVADPADWIPDWSEITAFAGYIQVLTPRDEGGQGFLELVSNSAIVAVLTAVLSLLFGALAAYAVARLSFPGRGTFSAAIIAVYFFPAILIAIPLFAAFSALGVRESLVTLAVVYVAQTLPVTLYMLRSYFAGIPKEIEEAAMMDGCGRVQVLQRVVLPLSAPAIVTVGLYVFMIAWNEFLYALLFLLQSADKWTLPLGLQQLDDADVPRTWLMAGSVIVTIPVVLIFLAIQRWLADGLFSGGVK